MGTIKILVACHKPDVYREDEVYTPIHVGRAVSKCQKDMQHMIGDNTGDNISRKNPYYCELTAQYWAWKNLHDVDYVGLAHYRRYFNIKITSQSLDCLFRKYDVVLSRKHYEKFSMADKISMDANVEDLYIFVHCIKKVSPEYYPVTVKILSGNMLTPFNMFIMRKREFDIFASWQFSVLFELEKMIKISNYCRPQRVIGYIAEIMLLIYSIHNNLKIKYEKVVDLCNNEVMPEKYNARRVAYVNAGFNCFYKRTLTFKNAAVMAGLKNDGIIVDL